jgi:hypothetical protein
MVGLWMAASGMETADLDTQMILFAFVKKNCATKCSWKLGRRKTRKATYTLPRSFYFKQCLKQAKAPFEESQDDYVC